MILHFRQLSASLSLLLLAAGSIVSADEGEELRFFENDIRPLLAAECYDCHGPEKSKAGLRLDHRELILKGGDSGAALVEGKPDESLLVEAVRRGDPDFSMPPKTELTAKQVAALEKWVALGAPWPEEKVTRSAVDEHGFSAEDRKWWAIQPVLDPSVPSAGKDWAKNDVDRFISARLEKENFQPAESAGAVELIRRMHFDLNGLPPSPEQVAAFEKHFASDADAAVAKVVDELLASPRYGERWGQHWLDVARYAETDGYRADDFRPQSWRYRDYVIRSINEDKPYTDFVREQLAADEFAADDPETLIATAFLRLGVYEWNQRNAEMQWDIILTEMTNVTAEAFLGLGIGCAQCHDHKFDPILQKDHFALQAFLNTVWWPEHQPLASPEGLAEYEAKLAEWEKAAAEIRTELDAMKESYLVGKRAGAVKQFPAEVKVMYGKPAEEQTAYEKQIAALVQRQVDKEEQRADFKKAWAKDEKKLARYTELTEALKKFDHLKPAKPPMGFISTDVDRDPAGTIMKTRDSEELVKPAFLTLLGQEAPKIEPTETTSGRRLALANWIADDDNPLSTRVVVNRIWQRHFGQGLVPTPNDFGRLGEEPSHPLLLDWLTKRFLEDGWRMKPLHRMIMTSASYRQTARREPGDKENLSDPGNRLLWRFPPRRLDAEQVRDAMLAVSGELKHRAGGPSVDGAVANRSVYVKKKRNTPDAVIGGFDAPLGFSSAPSRIVTTTPNQSLMLFNGEWAMKRAGTLADRILGRGGKFGAEQVQRAYRSIYGRPASAEEVAAAVAFVNDQEQVVGEPAPPAMKFPNEDGLRPIDQYFKPAVGGKAFGLGEKALWLQPGSRFERLEIQELVLPDDEFTIESVAILDAIHKDAAVNTLVSHWSGNQADAGWTFGITSEKSRYDPRNFIMQLIGDDFQNNRIYEVVASDLRFPIGKPVYIAATVSASPSADDVTKGTVTFYMKDLSDPKSPLETRTVTHQIVGGLKFQPAVKTLVSGRDQNGHLWDGQLARLVVSDAALDGDQLLVNGGKGSSRARRLVDLSFSDAKVDPPAVNTAWMERGANVGGTPAAATRLQGAVKDFCQALLNSNEFLYLH